MRNPPRSPFVKGGRQESAAMAKILTSLINEDITSKYSRLYARFAVYSDVLGCVVEAPIGFVHDYESVPVIKGTSKRGGVIHDYLSRSDSVPVVTKKQAADVYLEVMKCRDGLPDKGTTLGAFSLWLRRWVKYAVVLVAPRYFHRHKVMATFEEMSGQKERRAEIPLNPPFTKGET